jgi:AraC-like DNA-binding protein
MDWRDKDVYDSHMKVPVPDFGLRLLVCRFELLHQWNMRTLAAPYWRLYWVRGSGCLVKDVQGTHALSPDFLYLIPPDTACSGTSTSDVHQLYLHFVMRPRYVPSPRALIPIRIGAARRGEASACAEAVLSDQTDPYQLGHRAYAMIHGALRHLGPGDLALGSSDSRIDLAVERMRRDMPRPIPNAELAAAVHMNPNAFIRLFRETLGEPPQSYYLRLRIDRACRRLHFTEDSIDTIAEATGFCDRYHFSRVFKKYRKMGPAAFRNLRWISR